MLDIFLKHVNFLLFLYYQLIHFLYFYLVLYLLLNLNHIIKSLDSNFSANISFWTAAGGNNGSNTALERMTILNNGNVGININTPTNHLHLN